MTLNTIPYIPAMSKSHTYRNAYDVAPYTRIDTRLEGVDTWHTIACTREVSDWILEQNHLWYHSYPEPAYAKVYSSKFDIREELLLVIVMKFG